MAPTNEKSNSQHAKKGATEFFENHPQFGGHDWFSLCSHLGLDGCRASVQDVVTALVAEVSPSVLANPEEAVQELRAEAKRREASVMAHILENEIVPNAETIVSIHAKGRVALVVSPNLEPSYRNALRVPANGNCGVLGSAARKVMIQQARRINDLVTARWLKGTRPGRIFYISKGGGTLLLNFDSESGFTVEPDSLNWRAS